MLMWEPGIKTNKWGRTGAGPGVVAKLRAKRWLWWRS
jgi:hypothetical protein